jgi:hypothetical protein
MVEEEIDGIEEEEEREEREEKEEKEEKEKTDIIEEENIEIEDIEDLEGIGDTEEEIIMMTNMITEGIQCHPEDKQKKIEIQIQL